MSGRCKRMEMTSWWLIGTHRALQLILYGKKTSSVETSIVLRICTCTLNITPGCNLMLEFVWKILTWCRAVIQLVKVSECLTCQIVINRWFWCIRDLLKVRRCFKIEEGDLTLSSRKVGLPFWQSDPLSVNQHLQVRTFSIPSWELYIV